MPTQSGIWNLKQVRDSKALARYVPGVEIAGITGVIYFGATNTLTLNGNNFGVAATVRFGYGASVSDVVVTPISNTEITVAVPSAVSNNSVGTTISVSVIAGGQISEATTTTTQFLAPTGGTITINGLYTIHTFTSSGTFASNSLATDVE